MIIWYFVLSCLFINFYSLIFLLCFLLVLNASYTFSIAICWHSMLQILSTIMSIFNFDLECIWYISLWIKLYMTKLKICVKLMSLISPIIHAFFLWQYVMVFSSPSDFGYGYLGLSAISSMLPDLMHTKSSKECLRFSISSLDHLCSLREQA